jgi:phosphatidylethanolamine-binding protein (PEBP) family uncharacterized protein
MKRTTRKQSNRTKRSRKQSNRRGGAAPPFSVHYGSKKVAGQQFSQTETAHPPTLSIPKGHYVLMYDPDASKPDWIHWIVTAEETLLPYQGPTPPPKSGLHRYKFLLLPGEPPLPPKNRGGHDVTEVVNNAVSVAEFLVDAAVAL